MIVVLIKNSADIRCRPISALWQSWMCCLTPLFSLFRVCVKKSSQERLALKILIDRPKARNEVRGNTLTLLSDVCCSEQHFQSVCCLLPKTCYHPLSSFVSWVFSASVSFDLCRVVFLRCVSQLLHVISGHFCSGRAAYAPVRGVVKTDGHTL